MGEQNLGGATLKIIKQDLLETALEFFYPLKATINLKKNMGLLKIVLSKLCTCITFFHGICDNHIQSSFWLKSDIAMFSDHFMQSFRKRTTKTYFYVGVLLLLGIELNQFETHRSCTFPSVYCVLQQ